MKYEFAEIVADIKPLYSYFTEMAAGYETDKPADISIDIAPEDFDYERIHAEKGVIFPDYYLEPLAIYRKFCEYAVMEDVVLFHSSAVCVDGEAYVFTAPSGTGKSTHARLQRFSIFRQQKCCLLFLKNIAMRLVFEIQIYICD